MTPLTRAGPELSTPELYALLALRVEIFVVEQTCPYQEIDGRDLDPDTVHLWLSDSEGVTSSIRLVTDPNGDIRLGRVVTRTNRRGRGLSTVLMNAAIEQIGQTASLLESQTHAQTFYERFGYVADGPEFLEDNIPHVLMRRNVP